MVRPTVSPIQARVIGAVLGVSGFAFASISGLTAGHVAADSHIGDNKVWVTADGSDKGPAAGDSVRTIADCKDVIVWGNDLHNEDGHFTVYFDNHDPSGDDEKVDTQDWKYDRHGKDDQQKIATIDSRELIHELEDKGWHAADDGWHIDLKFSDPDRQVEFVLRDDCTSETHTTPVPVVQQAPAPVVAGTTTQAPRPAAVVPQTGADAPFLTGLMLMSAGGTAVGWARRLRRRQGR